MAEELLEEVPEGRTKEELLVLEQEHRAEEGAREKETAGGKDEPPRKLTVKGFSRSLSA